MTGKLINRFLLVASALILLSCASGSAIVTGKTRPPISVMEVRLYTEAPARYETIGIVKASSDAGWSEQDSVNYAVEELKMQAAKLGANGVLLTATGENAYSIVGSNPNGSDYTIPVSEQLVSGKAIYVNENDL